MGTCRQREEESSVLKEFDEIDACIVFVSLIDQSQSHTERGRARET